MISKKKNRIFFFLFLNKNYISYLNGKHTKMNL